MASILTSRSVQSFKSLACNAALNKRPTELNAGSHTRLLEPHKLTISALRTSIVIPRIDIRTEERNKETYIDAVPAAEEEAKFRFPEPQHKEPCVLCRLNLHNLNYTDVKILGQYLKSDGSVMTQAESQLCGRQYRKVESLIKKARRCNLIAREPGYFVPGPWHDMNTYLEIDRKRDQPMKVIKPEYWKL